MNEQTYLTSQRLIISFQFIQTLLQTQMLKAQTYVIGKGGNAEKVANKVQSNLVNAIGTVNRGVQVKNLLC